MWWKVLLVGVPVVVPLLFSAWVAGLFTVGTRRARALMAAYPDDLTAVADDTWGAIVVRREWTPDHVRVLAHVGGSAPAQVRASYIPAYLAHVAAGTMPGVTPEQHLTWMSVFLSPAAGRVDGTSDGLAGPAHPGEVDLADRALPWILSFGEDLAPVAAASGVHYSEAVAMYRRGHLDENAMRAMAEVRQVWLPERLG